MNNVAIATFKNLLNMTALKERLEKTDIHVKGRLHVLSYVYLMYLCGMTGAK